MALPQLLSARGRKGIISQNRRFILFELLTKKLLFNKTGRELYDNMLELYPHRVNPWWVLWSSARVVKP
jgi:hypothetical protein